MPKLPTIDQVLSDPCTSFWLEFALRSALNCDRVDVANDAQLLAFILQARCEEQES